jgi:hypothetical protein
MCVEKGLPAGRCLCSSKRHQIPQIFQRLEGVDGGNQRQTTPLAENRFDEPGELFLQPTTLIRRIHRWDARIVPGAEARTISEQNLDLGECVRNTDAEVETDFIT